MWFIFQTAMKSWRGKHYFHRGRKFWDNSLWGVCKITFFYFFLNWFPRNQTLLDSAIQKAGKLASRAAGKHWSKQFANLPDPHWSCRDHRHFDGSVWVVQTQHYPEANWEKASAKASAIHINQPDINQPEETDQPGWKIYPAFLSLTYLRDLKAYP